MQAILNIAIRASRKTGAYLLRERARRDQRIDSDALDQLRTDAAAILREAITKAYPHHILHFSHESESPIANEVVIAEGDDAEKLEDDEADDNIAHWHIELLDGVENFVCNIPHYAIVIAIESKGRVYYSMIYDPNADEIFVAASGGGAQYNSLRCRVTKVLLPQESFWGLAGLKQLPMTDINFVQYGSTALSMAYLAAGRLDVFAGEHLPAVAMKAGCLMMKEAGALLGDWRGELDYMRTTQLLAANPKLFKACLQTMRSGVSHE